MAWAEHVCSSLDKRYDIYRMGGVVVTYFAHVICGGRSTTVELMDGPDELLQMIHQMIEPALCPEN